MLRFSNEICDAKSESKENRNINQVMDEDDLFSFGQKKDSAKDFLPTKKRDEADDIFGFTQRPKKRPVIDDEEDLFGFGQSRSTQQRDVAPQPKRARVDPTNDSSPKIVPTPEDIKPDMKKLDKSSKTVSTLDVSCTTTSSADTTGFIGKVTMLTSRLQPVLFQRSQFSKMSLKSSPFILCVSVIRDASVP